MNFGEIINQIKQRWIISERQELINQFEEAPIGASTGGEVLHNYTGFLLSLKQSNPNAFKEIDDLVEEFAKESAASGTLLKGYKYKPYWRS